jgi:hypothetical protein
MSHFVALVMLFGREPRRLRRGLEAQLVFGLRLDNLEAFREMARNAERAATEQAVATDSQAGPPQE